MNMKTLSKALGATALSLALGATAMIVARHIDAEPLKAGAESAYIEIADGTSFTSITMQRPCSNGDTFSLYPAYGGEPVTFTSYYTTYANYWAVSAEDLGDIADVSELTLSPDGLSYWFGQISASTYNNDGVEITFTTRVFSDDVGTSADMPKTSIYDENYIQNYKIPLSYNQKFSQIYVKRPNFEEDNASNFNFLVFTIETKFGNLHGYGYGAQSPSPWKTGLAINGIDAMKKDYSNVENVYVAGTFGLFGAIGGGNLSTYKRLTAYNVEMVYQTTEHYAYIQDDFFIPYDDPYLVGYREQYNQGYADGYEAGKADGEEAGYSSGYTAGQTDGYTAGYQAGYEAGKTWKPTAIDMELPANWYPSQFVTYVTFWNYPRMPATDSNDVWFLLGSNNRDITSRMDVGSWNFYTDFEGRTTLYDGMYIHYKKFSTTSYYLIGPEGETTNTTTIVGTDDSLYYIEGIYIRKTTDALTTPSGDSIPYNCIAKAKIGSADGHEVVYDALDWTSDDYRSLHITAQTANTTSGYTWRYGIYTAVETGAERWTWLECDYAEAIKATGVSKVTQYTAYQQNAFDLLSSAFSSVATIMSISVFPYVTLGTLIFIPLVAIIIMAVVKVLGK